MKKHLSLICVIISVVGVGCATTRQPGYVYTTRSPQPVYVQTAPPPSSQDEYARKVLKQGLVGAATGAIAAEASGGKAGKGALIGAGTNIIGGAVLDAITTPSQPAPQYQPYANQGYVYYQPQKRIIRQYDSDGNVISEQEVWQ